MKTKRSFTALILGVGILLSSCTKEEITEQTIVQNIGPDVYFYSQEGQEDILMDVNSQEPGWILADQLAVLEIANLKEGDLIIAETQVRIRDNNSCDSRIRIKTGPLITSEIFTTPTDDGNEAESILAFAEDGPWRVEFMENDETFRLFERTQVAVIDTTLEMAYASLWLNAYTDDEDCVTTDGEGIIAEMANMVISVYRN